MRDRLQKPACLLDGATTFQRQFSDETAIRRKQQLGGDQRRQWQLKILSRFGGHGHGGVVTCLVKTKCRDRVRFIKEKARGVTVAGIANGQVSSPVVRVERLVK